jgi:probable phosphoglycerate mutase
MTQQTLRSDSDSALCLDETNDHGWKNQRSAMGDELPIVCLVRHAETDRLFTGQYTGIFDFSLTECGERNALRLGERLRGAKFEMVLTSLLQQSSRTCELAGFTEVVVDSDLAEWSYGHYEGRTNAEILGEKPGWNLFQDGCPAGESAEAVGLRADHVLGRLKAIKGNVLLFSSKDFLRVLAARWLGLVPADGRLFLLNNASLSILGYDQDRSHPVIQVWNDTSHLIHVERGQS